MKIKMLETFQSTSPADVGLLLVEHIQVRVFETDDVLEVNDTLGEWLIENHKAIEIKPVHYGAQPEPEPRNDEIKYKEMRAELTDELPEPDNELTDRELEFKPRKKRGKRNEA